MKRKVVKTTYFYILLVSHNKPYTTLKYNFIQLAYITYSKSNS